MVERIGDLAGVELPRLRRLRLELDTYYHPGRGLWTQDEWCLDTSLAVFGRVALPALRELHLKLECESYGAAHHPTLASLAALFAAPGQARSLEAFTYRGPCGVSFVPFEFDRHPLRALAAAELPALRSVEVRDMDFSHSTPPEAAAALARAPWASQLTSLVMQGPR